MPISFGLCFISLKQKYRKGSAYSPRGLSRYPELGLKGGLNISQVRKSGSHIQGTVAVCTEAQVPGKAQHVWGIVSGGDDDW